MIKIHISLKKLHIPVDELKLILSTIIKYPKFPPNYTYLSFPTSLLRICIHRTDWHQVYVTKLELGSELRCGVESYFSAIWEDMV